MKMRKFLIILLLFILGAKNQTNYGMSGSQNVRTNQNNQVQPNQYNQVQPNQNNQVQPNQNNQVQPNQNNQFNQNNQVQPNQNNQFNQNNQSNQNNQFNQNNQRNQIKLEDDEEINPKTGQIRKIRTACNLAVEVFPMYYVQILRKLQFRLSFTSNCLKKKDINFEINLEENKYLNWNFHPTIINLRLWDNYYYLEYKNPRTIDKYDILKSLQYQTADLKHIEKEKIGLNVMARNETFLDPQRKNTFNKYTIAKLKNKSKLTCKLRELKMRGWKILRALQHRLKSIEKQELGHAPQKPNKDDYLPADSENKKEVKNTGRNLKEDLKTENKLEKDKKDTEGEDINQEDEEKKAREKLREERKRKKEEEDKRREIEDKEDEKIRIELGKQMVDLLSKKEFIKNYEIDCFFD